MASGTAMPARASKGGAISISSTRASLLTPARIRAGQEKMSGTRTSPSQKAAAFLDETVVAEGLAMVTRENDDGVVALAGLVEDGEDAGDLVVDELDHGVVG